MIFQLRLSNDYTVLLCRCYCASVDLLTLFESLKFVNVIGLPPLVCCFCILVYFTHFLGCNLLGEKNIYVFIYYLFISLRLIINWLNSFPAQSSQKSVKTLSFFSCNTRNIVYYCNLVI